MLQQPRERVVGENVLQVWKDVRLVILSFLPLMSREVLFYVVNKQYCNLVSERPKTCHESQSCVAYFLMESRSIINKCRAEIGVDCNYLLSHTYTPLAPRGCVQIK